MNRREFLQGVAAIAAAAALPKGEIPEQPSGFDKLFASYPPQRAMTRSDLDKGVEMLRVGWPDPEQPSGLDRVIKWDHVTKVGRVFRNLKIDIGDECFIYQCTFIDCDVTITGESNTVIGCYRRQAT